MTNSPLPESHAANVVSYLDAHRNATLANTPRPVATHATATRLMAFAHRVPAGFPSPADDYIDDAIDLNREMIVQGHEASTFVLRVEGWSMVKAGIFDGDRIVVDRALEPRQGDVVVAIINNDLTVKRLGRVDGKLALLPDNPSFAPIVLADGDELEVWGVVTHGLRTFRRGA